jgi:hypothetical protein
MEVLPGERLRIACLQAARYAGVRQAKAPLELSLICLTGEGAALGQS